MARWLRHRTSSSGVLASQEPRPPLQFTKDSSATGTCYGVCVRRWVERLVRDIHQSDMDLDWVIVSTLENRHALAARFPEYRSEIPNASPPGQWNSIRARMPSSQLYRDAASDAVPVFELWHPTDRCASEQPTRDDGWHVLHRPRRRDAVLHAAGRADDSQPRRSTRRAGYGETWDLNNLQQAITSIISQVVSTRENFGARNVWATPGTRLSSRADWPGLPASSSQRRSRK